ncbi:IS6 family transposase [Halosimplex pelagicum]|uniref:IS6 family transposase n=1 Tax=Halosimplex pelagicum TaxID=869886 RepID=A0A7D5PCW3_9EURY|nr:IS6 family transposase [Halosimplex pelagicum]QLH83805.1 IS6 family transposase [Halosimplex pelagicum]
MAETARLSGHRDWIDLDFMERERKPEPAMALGIQSHVVGLSQSNTVEFLDCLGVDRGRKAVYDWVQKADLQPESGRSPNQIAFDETVTRINDQQFWLYTAVDPQTNELLHVRLFSTTTTSLTEIFLRELREKHDVETTVFLVDGAQRLQTALQRARLRFQMCRHGNRNAVERIFRELKRRPSSFSNCFSHIEPKTAENWLQSFARL